MDEETKELIKENNEMLKEILSVSQMTKKFVIWQQVFALLKILIIVIPIILGLIYLPAILADLLTPYKELLNMGGQTSSNLNSVTPDFIKNIVK